MEGLLPLVYKAIKKNRTRRQYECLSSGTALSYNINMVEINPKTQGHVLPNQTHPTLNVPRHHSDHITGHRRHKTVGDFASDFHSPQVRTGAGAGSPSSNKLVRFRSQRMFSCITGV